MEEFVWETAEELDMALAKRIKNIRKRRSFRNRSLQIEVVSVMVLSNDLRQPDRYRCWLLQKSQWRSM